MYTTKKIIKAQRKRLKDEEKTEKNYKNNQKTRNKMAVNTNISIITLNVNGLNVLIKRAFMVADWIKKKTRPIYMLLTRDSLQS